MAYTDIIRNGIALIDRQTKVLQATVTLKAWIGQDGAGTDLYASPVTLKALVDRAQKTTFGPAGQVIVVQCTVMFLAPIAPTTPNAGQQRINPVDPRDVVTLDDGFSGPIVKVGGFEDAGKTRPFYNEVMLGTAR